MKANAQSAVLLALPIAFVATAMAHVLWGGQILYRLDLLHYVYPMHELARVAYLDGRLPLWNPYIFCGAPLAATGDQGVFSPLFMLFLAGPVDRVYPWYLAVLQVTGAAGMAWMMRGRDRSVLAVAIAATGFALSGAIVSNHINPRFVAGAAFIPWALGCQQRAVDRRRTWFMGTAIAIAMQILEGCPELAWLTTIFCGLWGLLIPVAQPQVKRVLRFRFECALVLPLGSLALGLCIGAVQAIPLAEYIHHSTRAGGAGAAATEWALHPLRTAEILLPALFGDIADPGGYRARHLLGPRESFPWNATLYAGSIVVWLCVFCVGAISQRLRRGLAPNDDTRDAIFFALATLLCLMLAGASWVAALLPGSSMFRYAEKFAIGLAVCLPALAACGFELLDDRNRGSATLLAIGLAMLCLFLPMLNTDWMGMDATYAGARAAAALLGAALYAALPRHASAPHWPGIALVALLGLDLAAHARQFYPAVPRERLPDRLWAAEEIRAASQRVPADRLHRHPSRDPFPLAPELRHYTAEAHLFQVESLIRNACAGSASRVDGFAPARLQRFLGFFSAVPNDPERWRKLLNVRFCLTHPEASTPRGADLLAEHPPANLLLYEYPGVPPRIRVATRTRWVASHLDALRVMGSGDFDPTHDILIAAQTDAAPGDQHLGEGACEVLEYGPGRIKVATSSPSGAYLLVSDSWYPGWVAVADGRPRRVLRANWMFRAVEIPAGASDIELRFMPRSVVIGAGISLISLNVVVLLLVAHTRRRCRAA